MTEPRHFATASLSACLLLALCAGVCVAESKGKAPAKVSPPPQCDRSAFRIVLDVGHTLDVPGAMSARGVTEYAFNLQLAQDINKALTGAGFDKTVLMITDKPPPHSLVERAMRANTMRADLFLAIHHDSVPDNLMKTWDYQGQQNGYNDDYPGYALFVSYDNGDRPGSLQFGHFLGNALQAGGLQYTPHYTQPIMGHYRRQLVDSDAGVYRFDQLIVLRMTRMPAVLLEAGSIVNRPEELELGTPKRRAKTSAAIVSAVEEFCSAHTHPKAAPSVKQSEPPHTAAGATRH
jgi:N-acetylmuramoyl-L-alanine amidase